MRKWHVAVLAAVGLVGTSLAIAQPVDPLTDRVTTAIKALTDLVRHGVQQVTIVPTLVAPQPLLAPPSSGQLAGATRITDGTRAAVLTKPGAGAGLGDSGLVVAVSPTPAIQCPYMAAVNQTASATVITNPGNKSIHVCNVLLVTATAQSIGISEGTGSACGTGTIYWDGGSGGTVAPGLGGGYVVTSDRITYPMQSVGDNVCVLQSSTGNVSGHINYGVY